MIGGQMAQLDKTFPTGDCSMCILSPKLIECQRHPDIDILTHSTVVSVEGEAGNLTVKLHRRPRYVDEELCVGCGLCAAYCPVSAPDPFNGGLSQRKAISILCPQSVPLASSIDPDTCLFLRERKCRICYPVCKQRAIDFGQVESQTTLQVGAIIAAPGADTFDPALAQEYGYGRWDNVVSSVEFERLLNAAGPHQGQVLRPSDGRVPRRIAWVQCIGSRDSRFGHTYCSTVCCTYAVKQALLVKEHYADVQATLFFNDLRTSGKGCEAYKNRAEGTAEVRFIRSNVALREDPQQQDLLVTYASSDDGRVRQEAFDMAVLSVGLTPPSGNRHLARVLGLELDGHGFCKTTEISLDGATGRRGIFPAGSFTGPMDIPESISSATGAVARASGLLSSGRGTMLRPREYPVERQVEAQAPRIGVFVCHCGANIGRVVDVPAVVGYAATLPGVALAEENLFSCSADACQQLVDTIREQGLNRLVVAACTPRTHEPLFQDTLRRAGLNPYLFVMANIREHCSWVHSRERRRATDKAKDLVAMAVARAAALEPLQEPQVPVVSRGLVLGGGLAGMAAALSLAGQGFEVALVERESELGGNLKNLHHTLSGLEIQPFLTKLIHQVHNEERIEVYLRHELTAFSGSVGRFRSTIAPTPPAAGGKGEGASLHLEHGALIVATGAQAYQPVEYGYGQDPRILTQQEFERLLVFDPSLKHLRRVAMIQCVGSRDEQRPYCSRICCGQAIKNALRLKELNEGIEITVFYRDVRTLGQHEEYYAQARERGVLFIRYEPETAPQISSEAGTLNLTYREPVLGADRRIQPDLVVLSTAVVSDGNRELASLLKVPLTDDGFFMEAHVKMRPLDCASEGIYVCGMAHYPKDVREAVVQAEGAAARAATVLSRESITGSAAVCCVDRDACLGCGLCERACPCSAIELVGTAEGPRAHVIPTLCKGCGACTAICPSGGIINDHYTDRQIMDQIGAAYAVPSTGSEPKILAFLCNWCGYAGADLAGVSRYQYAPNIRVIRVMCSARVHSGFIMQAFLRGMDGVLVVGCHEEDCHYASGIHQAMRMVRKAKRELVKQGIDADRLRLEHISAGEGARFAQVVDGFTGMIVGLGVLELSANQTVSLGRQYGPTEEQNVIGTVSA
jgi:heterodisulfide reductase subunit A